MEPFEVLVYRLDEDDKYEAHWGPSIVFANDKKGAELAFVQINYEEMREEKVEELVFASRPFV